MQLPYKILEDIAKNPKRNAFYTQLVVEQGYKHFLKEINSYDNGTYQKSKADYKIYPYYIALDSNGVLSLYETKTDKSLQRYKQDLERLTYYYYDKNKQDLLDFIKDRIRLIIKEIKPIESVNFENLNTFKNNFLSLLDDATQNTINTFITFINYNILLVSILTNSNKEEIPTFSDYLNNLTLKTKNDLDDILNKIKTLREKNNELLAKLKQEAKEYLTHEEEETTKKLYKITKVIEIKQDSDIAKVEAEEIAPLDLISQNQNYLELKQNEDALKQELEDLEILYEKIDIINQEIKKLKEHLKLNGTYKYINRLYNDIFNKTYIDTEDYDIEELDNRNNDIRIQSANNVLTALIQSFSGSSKVADKKIIETAKIKGINNINTKRGTNIDDLKKVLIREILCDKKRQINDEIKSLKNTIDTKIKLLEKKGASDAIIARTEEENDNAIAKLKKQEEKNNDDLAKYYKNIFFYNDAYYITKKPNCDYIEDKEEDKIRYTDKYNCISILKGRKTLAKESEFTANVFKKILEKITKYRKKTIYFDTEDFKDLMQLRINDYKHKRTIDDYTKNDLKLFRVKVKQELFLLQDITIEKAILTGKKKKVLFETFRDKANKDPNRYNLISTIESDNGKIRFNINEDIFEIMINQLPNNYLYLPNNLYNKGNSKDASLAYGITSEQRLHRGGGTTIANLIPYTLAENSFDFLSNYLKPSIEKGLVKSEIIPKTESETFNPTLTNESERHKISRYKSKQKLKNAIKKGIKAKYKRKQ